MSNVKTLEEVKPEFDNRVFIGIDPGKSGGCGMIVIQDGIETSISWKFPKDISLLSVGIMSIIPQGHQFSPPVTLFLQSLPEVLSLSK